jgi:excisionase family DNA binding protein
MVNLPEDRPMDSSSTKLVLSASETAGLLGISRAHLWRLHSSGRLPRPIRLGRAVRWDRKTLEAWVAAGAPPRDQWESKWPRSR